MKENLYVGKHKHSNSEWDAGFEKVAWNSEKKEPEKAECTCEKKCRGRQGCGS
jgi:hypothetical protein